MPARLRELFTVVLEPPAVIALHGRSSRLFLEQTVPNLLDKLRVLDLWETARILADMHAGADVCALAGKLGSSTLSDADSPLSPAAEQLLWAVISEAGQRGLGWVELLDLARKHPVEVDFAAYKFSDFTLANLPESAGVYTMLNAAGESIYVGKAANLRRRLQDYFRVTRDVSDKHAEIRDRIRDFTYAQVGSELEALLLENKLIRELAPALNVQRRVVAGSKTYALGQFPAALVLRSAWPRRCEICFLGPGRHLPQLRVDPKRIPRRTVARLAAWSTGASPGLPRHPNLKDWGRDGATIADRYFARYRSQLQWLEIVPKNSEGDLAEAVQDLMLTVLADPKPTEFRI